jgi:hypothetical protein
LCLGGRPKSQPGPQNAPGANGGTPGGQNGGGGNIPNNLLALNRNREPGVFASDPYHDDKGRFTTADDDILGQVMADHGETKDFHESGYVMPNGKMPDMSDGHPGHRKMDHDEVLGELPLHRVKSQVVPRMLAAGAVRISTSDQFGGVIHAGHQPITPEQQSTLRKLVDAHNGKIFVEVTNHKGELMHERGYDEGTSHTKIFGDISRAQRSEKIQSALVAAKSHHKKNSRLPKVSTE